MGQFIHKEDKNNCKTNRKPLNAEAQDKDKNAIDLKNNNNDEIPNNINIIIKASVRDIFEMMRDGKNIYRIDSKVLMKIPSMSNHEQYNYNTFCTFKSKDDIIYLVFVNGKYDIIFYNIIDEKKVIEIVIHDDNILELKYLFDEYNNRDLLFSISDKKLKLWDINNFKCLFDLKENYSNFSHLGFLKENNERYIIIVSHKNLSIFDLNGNKFIDYKGYSEAKNFSKHKFIDTYYDKKFDKNYIFMLNDNYDIYSIDYQKNELYQKYYSHNKPKPVMSFYSYNFKESDNFRILFNESENILKVVFPLYDEDAIGVFNFHSGEIMYKIDLSRFKDEIFLTNNITDIYSISFLNDNYISLSIGKNVIYTATSPSGLNYPTANKYHSNHSIQIINLKHKIMREILKLDISDKYIFVKNIFHPKYGECLLTQDACGEIILMKIYLECQ